MRIGNNGIGLSAKTHKNTGILDRNCSEIQKYNFKKSAK